MDKKPYSPPTIERWGIKKQNSLNLLASLSIAGNVSDWEAGDEDDLYEDDWE